MPIVVRNISIVIKQLPGYSWLKGIDLPQAYNQKNPLYFSISSQNWQDEQATYYSEMNLVQ